MITEALDQQVQRAQERLQALFRRTRAAHDQGIIDEALEELSIVLHALEVTTEQLREQAEELTKSRNALEAEQRYRELFEFAPDGYLVTDTDALIAEANRAAATLLGLRADFMRGKPLLAFIGAEYRPWLRDLMRHMRESRESFSLELTLEARDRLPFPVDVTLASMLNRDQEVIGFRWSIRDISQLKHAEAQSRQSERLAGIGQMAAGLAHETRNAVQRSKACLEMLALEVHDRPTAINLVARVQKAQNDLYVLHEEVREYAAPLVLQQRPQRVDSILRQAWDELDFARERRQAILRQNPACIDLTCDIDPSLLIRVFSNILKNSLDACPDPVEIDIQWSEHELDSGPALGIAIRDNGPGLKPEQHEKLFTPFYTTKTHGTGLGLAIVKRIIDAHGGRISTDRHVSGGAEIKMSLPRKAVKLPGGYFGGSVAMSPLLHARSNSSATRNAL